jgi:ribosomal-protein-alanine N-acetyltransferase
MTETATIRTSRLVLSPAARGDADEMWPHVSDPEISAHMSWAPHTHIEETVDFLGGVENNWRSGKSLTWTMRRADTAALVGVFSVINVHRTHRALVYDRGERASGCARQWRGAGLMTEAGEAVIDYAFGPLGLNRLLVGHHLDNPSSERLIRRLGFEEIGVEHEAFKKHGQWIDIRMYELLRSRRRTRDEATPGGTLSAGKAGSC